MSPGGHHTDARRGAPDAEPVDAVANRSSEVSRWRSTGAVFAPASPLLVPGTTVVAFLLGTGRWGSYLGWPQDYIFLTDIALVLGTCWLLVRRRHLFDFTSPVLRALLPVAALLTWSLARIVMTGRLPSVIAARDAAPYAYAVVAFAACVQTDTRAWSRSLGWLRIGLLFHALWVTVSLHMASLAADAPLLGGRVHVLEIRSDFDATVLAVTCCFFLVELARSGASWRARLVSGSVAAWAVYLILAIANRAGLLALLFSVLVAVVASAGSLRRVPRRYLIGAAVAGLLLMVVLVPQTGTYQRLAGAAAFSGNAAAGTTVARERAWSEIFDYIDASAPRVVAGVGFGPDFLAASGAAPIFEGTTYTDVRAPHNYLINTYARLGLIGVVLVGWLLVALAIAGWRVLRGGARSLAMVFCATISGSLLISSLVGVILESPFGAIPFFWTAGHLLVRGAKLQQAGAAST